MKGYWGDEKKTKELIDTDGWLHSGDIGNFDEDGYLTLVGRSKDMIIRGGENIYPIEIEEFMISHPSIIDVQAISVHDDKMGEEICVWIQLKDGHDVTAKQLVDFCKGKIAHFKIPRYFKFVEEYPLTVTKKVKKNVMRDISNEQIKEGSNELIDIKKMVGKI